MTALRTVLLVVGRARVCALPLSTVVETMRPLPIEEVAGVPPFVLGVSVIRGAPTAVVDLGALFFDADADDAGFAESSRFVTVRLKDGEVLALAVTSVVGVRLLDDALLGALPPLLRSVRTDALDAIGTIDARLLVTLREGWALPDDVARRLAAAVHA